MSTPLRAGARESVQELVELVLCPPNAEPRDGEYKLTCDKGRASLIKFLCEVESFDVGHGSRDGVGYPVLENISRAAETALDHQGNNGSFLSAREKQLQILSTGGDQI